MSTKNKFSHVKLSHDVVVSDMTLVDFYKTLIKIGWVLKGEKIVYITYHLNWTRSTVYKKRNTLS